MGKRTTQKSLKVVISRAIGLSWDKKRAKIEFTNKFTTRTTSCNRVQIKAPQTKAPQSKKPILYSHKRPSQKRPNAKRAANV